MKLTHSLALTLPLASSWAMAADLTVKFELPQLNVAEYHKPYVAIWIEKADASVASNLALLYDVKKRDGGGEKWVKDLRTWWRKAGRDMKLPADGLSGATRSPGNHALTFTGANNDLAKLPAGQYTLVVEAAREVGGREVVKVPFAWNGKGNVSASAKGKEELGTVAIVVK